jgi:acyl carrier protein
MQGDDIRATIDFSSFAERLAQDFGWSHDALEREARLVEECGLDSLGMYELLLVLEDGGYRVDEDDLMSWMTLGDVYECCSRRVTDSPR